MSCPCVITPGCKLHSKPFIEPGVTSQGPPLEEAPESIRLGKGFPNDGIVYTTLIQDNKTTWRDVTIEPIGHLSLPQWRCLCDPESSTSRLELNLYQVWLSARRHFWWNHADKGTA